MAKRTVSGPKIDGLELRAAAAAAYVVGGRAQRRDLGGSRMRDFDLRYPDGRADEPLEITSCVDRAGLETWKRVGRKDPIASMVSRVWTLDMPSREQGPDGSVGPSDVSRFFERAGVLLHALEERGQHEFQVPGLPDDKVVQGLTDLGCDMGFSRVRGPDETGRIETVAPVGGFTHRDSVAWAIEREAAKTDNQEKLSRSPDSERRHLFVVPHPSAAAVYLSVRHGKLGRLPVLPSPITTAWVWDGNGSHVFVATPPSSWEDHELPSHVLDEPEKWVK
jgi:hypothetical protein